MNTSKSISRSALQPIIKWAGGKEKELGVILDNAPASYNDFYEPFVGGGAVFTACYAKRYFINDRSDELIALYRSIATLDRDFFHWMGAITSSWYAMLRFVDRHRELCSLFLEYRNDLRTDSEIEHILTDFVDQHVDELNHAIAEAIPWHRQIYIHELSKNVVRKVLRMKKIELERQPMPDRDIFSNIETAFMGAHYMYFRTIYNDSSIMRADGSLATAFFVFMRNYAYSGMFRYNARGEFNVPYGGIAYNHKRLHSKIDYYQSPALRERMEITHMASMDFERFLTMHPPQKEDFIFLNPPYDSEFSTYAQNEFTQDDQARLASYLIDRCRGQWMLVIKNTPFIASLYEGKGLTIKSFNKKYLVSFMNRNDKNAEHLIIMNYSK